MLALRRLWEQDKLSDTQFMRAFLEVEETLSDVTEKGIGITGMAARIGETKTFVIPAGDFIETDPILLEARCQWAEEERENGRMAWQGLR